MWMFTITHEITGKHSEKRKKQPTEKQKNTKYRNMVSGFTFSLPPGAHFASLLTITVFILVHTQEQREDDGCGVLLHDLF